MHTFTSHGHNYRFLDTGVIEQINPEPYIYDASYIATYDTEAYIRGNETLQALRYGFVCAAHGRPIDSLLDIGCANGAFLYFAGQHCNVCGYDITGIKLDGLTIIDRLEKAAVWAFWDVLEHIHDCSFLIDAPCETICVSLPYCHYLSEGQDWFDKKYKHRKPNEHIRHFTPVALNNFMEEFGWHALLYSTHEDIIRKSEHGLPNILSMAFKRFS